MVFFTTSYVVQYNQLGFHCTAFPSEGSGRKKREGGRNGQQTPPQPLSSFIFFFFCPLTMLMTALEREGAPPTPPHSTPSDDDVEVAVAVHKATPFQSIYSKFAHLPNLTLDYPEFDCTAVCVHRGFPFLLSPPPKKKSLCPLSNMQKNHTSIYPALRQITPYVA